VCEGGALESAFVALVEEVVQGGVWERDELVGALPCYC
jgi:hypothetical protein